MEAEQLKILCIDDSRDIIQTLVAILTKGGFLVYSASTPELGIAIAKKLDPDLILLDIMMPGMSGYEVCRTLQRDELTSHIPVVFMSALNQPQNKISALAAGGVNYLTKPFDRQSLLETTRRYAVKKKSWGACLLQQAEQRPPAAGGREDCNFTAFKINIIDRFKPDSALAKAITALQPEDVYKLAGILRISASRVARLIAAFSKRPFFPLISPDDIKLGVLPLKFAALNNIVAVNAPGELALIAISHPFNFELYEMISNLLGSEFELGITEPSNISMLYTMAEDLDPSPQTIAGGAITIEAAALNRLRAAAKSVKNEINEPHVKYLTGRLLQFLAEEKPVKMRIEAKGACYLITAGAGAPDEFPRFSTITGNMVIARLKALGGMDITERNRPQTGAFVINCPSGNGSLTLATEATDYGETILLSI